MQASRSASERKRVNRRVNQRFLSAMAEMGIPSDQAELALHETGNVGVEGATEWLFSVPPDVLETHLSGEPGTPQEEVGAVHDDGRVLVPKRVALQVGGCGQAGGLVWGEGSVVAGGGGRGLLWD